MARYMFTASYSTEGSKGLLADGGTARTEAVDALLRSVGGSLEAAYFSPGAAQDVVLIVTVPDNDSEGLAACLMTVGASGGVTSLASAQLLTPAEIDAATKRSPTYRAPGA